MANRRRKSKSSNALPLIIVGTGLILLAIAGAFLRPKLTSSAADSSAGSSGASSIPAAVNYPAPELILADVNGVPVALEDYRGGIVLVNNWATWCPPCRAEMPELEAFFETHRDENFTLIGISAGDTASQVEEFIAQNGITFPMWLDADGAALRAFKNNSLPSSYVIDSTGTVRLAWTGAISLEMLEKHVTPLLSE
ncbi:MAG: TlpA family protein disulfide reductase [Chloroflexi bacterium]|jgi:cytochrome c biogenesis protein CcmG, thiol:disulfide interchange protein DsbE|nr:TlpA family protein disulfide reductase [Chloroflexota bacterium]